MAIINCPACRAKISSKLASCPHCGHGARLDEEAKQRLEKHRLQRKLQQISMQNMLAVIVAMAGFYVFHFQQPAADSLQAKLSLAAIAIGFIGYIINRVRHFLIKSAIKNS